MINWETIISTVIGVTFASVVGLFKFNSNFSKLGTEVKSLGKRMVEMKTEIKAEITGIKTENTEIKTEITGIKTDVAVMKTEIKGIKTEITGIKTDIKERDEKTDKKFDEIKAEIEKRDEKIEKKFDEVKGDIKDLRTEITGRKMEENFDQMKTDIKYIKEGFEESDRNISRKSASKGRFKENLPMHRGISGTLVSKGPVYLEKGHAKTGIA